MATGWGSVRKIQGKYTCGAPHTWWFLFSFVISTFFVCFPFVFLSMGLSYQVYNTFSRRKHESVLWFHVSQPPSRFELEYIFLGARRSPPSPPPPAAPSAPLCNRRWIDFSLILFPCFGGWRRGILFFGVLVCKLITLGKSCKGSACVIFQSRSDVGRPFSWGRVLVTFRHYSLPVHESVVFFRFFPFKGCS